MQLDIISNEIFINTLAATNKIALMVSEEDDEAVIVDGAENAHYVAAIDPLDGK